MMYQLAWRQIKSQGRRSDWRALLLAMFLMTALMTLLSLTGERIEKSLVTRSAELMGADMIFSSSRPFSEEENQQTESLITEFGLNSTPVTQFASMVEANEQLLLASIRAVQSPYPLKGEIVKQPTDAQSLPYRGEIWVEQNVLDRLNIQQGDALNIGYQSFKISHIMISSPDRGTGFRSFNPQIIMRHSDLEATGVIAPGSRAQYRLLLSGNPESTRAFESRLKPDLPSWQRIYRADGDQPASRNAMSNAAGYLKLSALFALLIGVFSIYLSLRRYSHEQTQRSALLLSLGASPKQIRTVYLLQLTAGWLMACLPGILTGWLLHQALIVQLGDLLPKPLPDFSLWSITGSALLAGMILYLIGYATLSSQTRVSVLNLIRKSDATDQLPLWIQIAIPASLMGLVSLYVESVVLAAILTVALLLLGTFAGWLTQRLIHLLAKLLKQWLPLPSLLKLRLNQQRRWHRVQGGVLALLLALLSTLLTARSDLLSEWQSQLPVDTPTQFLINIQPWEKDSVDAWFKSKSVDTTLYPMIRGRVEALNGKSLQEAFNAEQRKHNTLNRELNLTWREQPPAHNEIIEGRWDTAKNSISVESEMARELGLGLGDSLTFQVGGERFEGKITSIRAVEWGSFRPNFYVIFSPGVIDNLPSTYITSFKLDGEQKSLTRDLLTEFPTLTLIDIEQLLIQAQQLIDKLSDSASLVLVLTMLSGLLLVITTLQQDLRQRRQEVALLRTLGASDRQTHQLNLSEFLLVGLSCGAIAAAISELLLFAIYTFAVQLPATIHPEIWVLIPLGSAFLFCLTGLMTRRRSPLANSYQLLKGEI